MTDFDRDFIERAKAKRLALRWGQRTLADRMQEQGFDWHHNTVARHERHARPVRLAEAATLARILGIPLVADQALSDGLSSAHREIGELRREVERLRRRERTLIQIEEVLKQGRRGIE